MASTKIFNTQDLVLKVNTRSYDPEKVDLASWTRFLDVLCQTREFQKEAIKTAIIYLASGRYSSIEDLVSENYKTNDQLRIRYAAESDYINKLQLKKKIAATIDLATGTGKSYVMYGIAQIALGLGLVDKVLVLGPPSLTIEAGLKKKFEECLTNPLLKNSIPEGANFRNPKLISADETILEGSICIENINAVYAKTGSSILDSLVYKGQTCLVLCDEVHHAFNTVDGSDEAAKSIKKWKEFLLDDTFSFKYILGFTGTAYINNEYFNDVIYRYSLRQAIESKFVKSVNYVVEDESIKEHEKFQKILQNHERNRILYPKVKPLTILITRDIKNAKQLKTRLVEFLVKKKIGTEEEISNDKVILVTSDKEHKSSVLKLPYVDSQEEPAEWIISVAMLTEGWDVKNVFQIVPMEEKAFNSKLLIAQVLGRGLRIPEHYPNAEVTVFNHDKWSGSIKALVSEILEMETRIKNSIILEKDRSKYHFKMYNVSYKREYSEVEAKETKVFNYKDYIEFVTETFEHKTETKYIKVNGKEYPLEYQIEKEKFSVEEIVNKVYDDFQLRKLEGIILNLDETEYTSTNLPSKETIEKLIRKSMEKVGMKGDYLGASNRQAVYSTFNTLLRKKPRSISLVTSAENLVEVDTKKREHESISALSLKTGECTIFYTTDYETEIVISDTLLTFNEVKEDLSLPRSAFSDTINPFVFKTPIDIVFSTKEPERKFIQNLIKNENAKHLDAWIKSKNQNFYSLEYSITTKAGRHSSQHLFNPDFFLLQKKGDCDHIVVIETKSDNDDSDENRQKYKYAVQHFFELNKVLSEKKIKQKYFFHFLSPNSYNVFFECLADNRVIDGKFKSELDLLLEKEE